MTEPFCSLCQQPFDFGQEESRCAACGARYHADCHVENGGCGTYGCALVPKEAAQSQAGPMTYWGRETKPCSSCGKEIKTAALRCRHCGATFGSAIPATPEEHQARLNREDASRRVRRRATVVFVGGLIPFALPLVLAAAAPLLIKERRRLATFPPFDRFLFAAGVALSLVWVAVAVLVLFLVRG